MAKRKMYNTTLDADLIKEIKILADNWINAKMTFSKKRLVTC
jgi:hypothetical protein